MPVHRIKTAKYFKLAINIFYLAGWIALLAILSFAYMYFSPTVDPQEEVKALMDVYDILTTANKWLLIVGLIILIMSLAHLGLRAAEYFEKFDNQK